MGALGVFVILVSVGTVLLVSAMLKGYGVQAAIIFAMVLTMAVLGLRGGDSDQD